MWVTNPGYNSSLEKVGADRGLFGHRAFQFEKSPGGKRKVEARLARKKGIKLGTPSEKSPREKKTIASVSDDLK